MTKGKIVYLSGGVGGAKLALGLDRVLKPGQLTIIANTGDDFRHLGLFVCPDIDTLVYTLSGEANQAQGWGRQGETGQFMKALQQLGGEDWFFLGDMDLAMHVERSHMLAAGRTLTQVTGHLSAKLNIASTILPMCDQPAPTIVHTDDGPLSFQHYFVRDRATPIVRRLALHGGDDGGAAVSAEVASALRDPDLAAIVIGPSNPYISIDPILSLPGMAGLIRASGVPCIAVSPVIGGQAVKGPTAKLMREFGHVPSNRVVRDHYQGVITHLLIDGEDASEQANLVADGLNVVVAQTMMTDMADKKALAGDILTLLK